MAKKSGIKNAVINAGRKAISEGANEVKASANKAIKKAAKPKLSRTPQISKTPYRGGAKVSTMPKKGNDKPKVTKVKYI